MLKEIHGHIVNELQQNAKTDTVFVVAAVLWGGRVQEDGAPGFSFPPPTGPYAVGTRFLHLVDESRPDAFSADPNDHRWVSVQVFYPVEPGPGSGHERAVHRAGRRQHRPGRPGRAARRRGRPGRAGARRDSRRSAGKGEEGIRECRNHALRSSGAGVDLIPPPVLVAPFDLLVGARTSGEEL